MLLLLQIWRQMHTCQLHSKRQASCVAVKLLYIAQWQRSRCMFAAGFVTASCQHSGICSSMLGARMRSGDAGEQLPRDVVAAADLATNAYLPAAQ
jgi:hypothetical protein